MIGKLGASNVLVHRGALRERTALLFEVLPGKCSLDAGVLVVRAGMSELQASDELSPQKALPHQLGFRLAERCFALQRARASAGAEHVHRPTSEQARLSNGYRGQASPSNAELRTQL